MKGFDGRVAGCRLVCGVGWDTPPPRPLSSLLSLFLWVGGSESWKRRMCFCWFWKLFVVGRDWILERSWDWLDVNIREVSFSYWIETAIEFWSVLRLLIWLFIGKWTDPFYSGWWILSICYSYRTHLPRRIFWQTFSQVSSFPSWFLFDMMTAEIHKCPLHHYIYCFGHVSFLHFALTPREREKRYESINNFIFFDGFSFWSFMVSGVVHVNLWRPAPLCFSRSMHLFFVSKIHSSATTSNSIIRQYFY